MAASLCMHKMAASLWMHSHHATLMYSFGKIIYVHNFYNMKICAHSEFYKNDTINVSLCSVSANIFLKTNVVRVLLHFYSSWWVRQMHYNDNMESKIQRETPKNRIVFVTTIDANEETLKGWSKKGIKIDLSRILILAVQILKEMRYLKHYI